MRKVVVFSSITKLLKKKPTLSSYPSQSRHFLSPLLLPSSSSSVTQFVPNLFATTLRNANLKLKFGNVLESKAGFFDPHFPIQGLESKGFTGFQKRGWKSWFNGANGVVLGLIIANAAVFTMWKVSDKPWMIKNFVLSVDSFTTGRIHTLITSGFSHIAISQLITNMIGLCYFGTRIANTMGPLCLLKLYFAGALGGNVVFLSHHALRITTFKGGDKKEKRNTNPIRHGRGVAPKKLPQIQSRLPVAQLSADGSVFAIVLLDIFLNPKVTTYFALMFRVPVMLGILFGGNDMLKVLEGKKNNIISCSNLLGGGMVAAIAWARLRKGRFRY
ncbi:hypothetical protein AALP_AA2G180100 [Arabis alpina]|uniref:Peptidase S54 rhomboid domain-containing protein n=1 Tax=Arabis alpina TaxID=50452 RepID=A0A087HIA6_ARAAL|nr:hypothetical protein AALP_AA2G180100 [Arabis alpina]